MPELGRAVKLPPLDYVSPASVDEVIRLLDQKEDAKVLSGGQSLMPMLAFRMASCRLLVDLKKVPGLDRIAISDEGIELGAKVRWRDIERHPHLAQAHPLLSEAVAHIAHYQIRNRGTIGGSLAHADPAAELPAIAVTCDAQIVAQGPNGRRRIPASEFFLSPLNTALEPNELIVAMELPFWPRERRYGFIEFPRRSGDFALAGAAIYYDLDGKGRICTARVGAFGIGDTPVRLHETEKALTGTAPEEKSVGEAIRQGIATLEIRSDLHADESYRRALLETLLNRAFKFASARAGS